MAEEMNQNSVKKQRMLSLIQPRVGTPLGDFYRKNSVVEIERVQ